MEKKLPVKKNKKMSPEQLVQAISDLCNSDEGFTSDQVVDLLKKNKAGRFKDVVEKVIIPISQAMFTMKEAMEEDVAVSFASGMYLQDEPVILEYLGFEEYIVEEKQFSMRIYKKGNFTAMRNYFENIEDGKDKWIVTKVEDEQDDDPQISLHRFDNMLEAVVVFKSMGMDISIMDVVTSKFVS